MAWESVRVCTYMNLERPYLQFRLNSRPVDAVTGVSQESRYREDLSSRNYFALWEVLAAGALNQQLTLLLYTIIARIPPSQQIISILMGST